MKRRNSYSSDIGGQEEDYIEEVWSLPILATLFEFFKQKVWKRHVGGAIRKQVTSIHDSHYDIRPLTKQQKEFLRCVGLDGKFSSFSKS